LRWLSSMAWWAGDRAAAERDAAEAIAVLEPAGDRPLLALALRTCANTLGCWLPGEVPEPDQGLDAVA
jgi:hypothetical protein